MTKALTLILVIAATVPVLAQTNPSPQTLPYSQTFGTTTFTAAPAGTAVWNGLSGNTINTEAKAEASAPTGNGSITAASSSQTTGGAYGYATSSNGRLYIQSSTNATNGVNQLALAVNTGTATNITISYSIQIINAGASTIIMGSVLQYRQGTSGSWTTIDAVEYAGNSVSAGNTFDYSYNLSGLMASTVYQFRFAHWRGGSGSSMGIAYDNINISATALPIQLTQFTAEKLNRTAALLSFATALEQNNDYFSIERSADGLRFNEIGRVQGAGNSLETREYSYTDNTPLRGINYYRLKQTDYDGKFTFSPVVSLNFDGIDRGNGVRLSPQPVKDQLTVTLEQAFQQDARWELFDLSGRLLQAGTLSAEANNFSIQAATLTDGAYVLRITGDQQVITRKFEKN